MKTALAMSALMLLATAVWWFALDSRAPRHASGAIPLQALREAIAHDARSDLPSTIELYRVGSGEAPMFAVEAGGGFGKFRMAYTAFGLVYRDHRIMIDAAADRQTAMTIGDRDAARFADRTYALLLERMAEARTILLTHEHKDHVMAVARHPALPSFANRLIFPESQRYGLLRYTDAAPNRAAIAAAPARPLDRVERIAPGVAIAPAPGHSPGSMVILVRRMDGTEYLFIGDIAWSFQDILRLRTRPRFLQWLMFDPSEDRPAVLSQLRALHDLHAADPALVIVPSHDNTYFDRLIAEGKLSNQG